MCADAHLHRSSFDCTLFSSRDIWSALPFKLSCPLANWVPILQQLRSIRTSLISLPALSVWSHCAALSVIGADIRLRDCRLLCIFDLLSTISKEHLVDRKTRNVLQWWRTADMLLIYCHWRLIKRRQNKALVLVWSYQNRNCCDLTLISLCLGDFWEDAN